MFDDYTVNEAALVTGLKTKQIEGYIRRQSWPSYVDGDGRRRIERRFVDDFGFSEINPEVYSYDSKFDIPRPELWGEGKPPVVEPATKEHWETVVSVSDIHVPYHDPVLIDAVIEMIRHIQPHRVIINGDTNDFFNISRFNKAFERLQSLQTEIDMGKQIRLALRDAAPNAIFEETLGNHEERLITYPGFNAPALQSLTAMKPSKLLGLDELEIRHWPQNGFRLREEFVVEHGAIVRKDSGASAKARLNDTLISGIMGHTHRQDGHTRTGYRELSWYEQGCLCMLNPDYVKTEANWKQGFAIGMFSTKTDNFNVQLIPAVGRGFIFDGRHYGDTEAEADVWSGPVPNIAPNLTYELINETALHHAAAKR